MAQVASKNCEICARAPGIHYCTKCDQMFCRECKTSHLRSKVSKNHLFSTGSNITPKANVVCSKHNEDYIFYCVPCDTPVCKICMTESHNRHNISQVNEIVSKLKAELEHQLLSKVTYLKSGVSKVEKASEWLTNNVEKTIKEIHLQGQRLKNKVDMEMEKLIQSVRKTSSEEIQKLTGVDTDLRDSLEKGNSLQISFKEMTNVKDELYALDTLQKLTTETNKIKVADTSMISSLKYEKFTGAYIDSRNILGTLSYQQNVEDLALVLIGCRGSGKSSTGNSIIGKPIFKVCHGTKPGTSEIFQASVDSGEHSLTVFDTPGLRRVSDISYIKDKVYLHLKEKNVQNIVFVINIHIGRLTQEDITILGGILKQNEDIRKSSVILFTNKNCSWEETDEPVEPDEAVHSWIKMNPALLKLLSIYNLNYVAFENRFCLKEEKYLQVQQLISVVHGTKYKSR